LNTNYLQFLIVYVATTEAPLEHKLRYAFNVYDLDHNSMIDRAEILFILRAMFELLGMNENRSQKYSYEECADKIMKNLDINKDQCISKEEFIQGLTSDPFLQSLMNPFQNA
jgi:Ca2+-binding EF-hand superfamily protein